MGIEELMSLKGEYERELIMAQAKVAVVDDIIARFQPEVVAQTESDEEVAEEQNNFTDQAY